MLKFIISILLLITCADTNAESTNVNVSQSGATIVTSGEGNIDASTINSSIIGDQVSKVDNSINDNSIVVNEHIVNSFNNKIESINAEIKQLSGIVNTTFSNNNYFYITLNITAYTSFLINIYLLLRNRRLIRKIEEITKQ